MSLAWWSLHISTGGDYHGPAYVKIPAGRSSVIFYIRTHHDHIFEGYESFAITAMLPSDDTCTTNVTIMDKSKLPIANFFVIRLSNL